MTDVIAEDTNEITAKSCFTAKTMFGSVIERYTFTFTIHCYKYNKKPISSSKCIRLSTQKVLFQKNMRK